ncbi:MAG: hypothetical protein DMF72_07770 [Acidobacteria bacterium]|nr:MAG: hypothetical protein DMF72_07770 [Acidobacteriota bacterium]
MLTATATLVPAALPESPFRGIESFRYVDQPIFFARNEDTRKLLRYVAVYRGVLFYGESGCGKSSLINAGFIPAIIDEGFTPDRLRVQPKPGEEIIVERISTKDTGEAPYLPSSFIGDENSASRVVLSTDKLRDRLQELRASSPTRRPLLIFDQFEEFATLFEEAPRGDDIESAQQAQQAILKLIVELQRDVTLPVKLLFSFREDYLAKLSKLISLWPDLSDQSLRLTPPSKDALPTIIRGSFEKYPGSFGKELSANLTDELVTALEARNEGGKLNLSEVQIACLQLWKAGDPEVLFKAKGVQGLLEDYLSDSLNRLPENLRDPAVALLSRMVTPSGTRNIVSEYDLISQVCEDEGIPEDRVKEACQALVQQTKLVRRERRYDTYFYDIVSEFLVPWIRRKKFERNAEIERRKLEVIEKRKRRKVFAFALASLVLALAIGLTAFLIIRERNRTITFQQQTGYLKILQEKAVQDAQSAQARAEQERKQADEMAMVAEYARAHAVQEQQAALKEYTDVSAQFQALQKTSDGLKKENDKLNQKIQDLNSQVLQANSKARSQTDALFKETYSGLVDTERKMNELRKQLDPKLNYQAYQLSGQIQSQLSKVRSDLRSVEFKY